MIVCLYHLSPTPASLLITHVTQYLSILTLLWLLYLSQYLQCSSIRCIS